LVVYSYVDFLRHTPYECPRRRYPVLREAPEKVSDDNDRRRRPAPQELTCSEELSPFEKRFE
jgi:hypothetical protein